MIKLPASSFFLVALAVCCLLVTFVSIPQSFALPVSYNTTSINLGLTSVPRNSSSYDVFTLNQDNWLWEKFDNNTIDSGPLSVTGTVTYNTNLKALWKFENVLTDSSSSGKTLTKGAGTTTYTTSAEEGSGLVFDGSTWYSASDATLPTGTNPVSLSFWINPSTFTGTPVIVAYGTGAHNIFALFFDTNGKLNYYDGTTGTIISTTAFTVSNWVYVTVTYDGTNARVYINGSLDKTTAITVNTTLAGASGFTLGSLAAGSGTKFTGKFDEFRVYSGTALTLQQHKALYMVGHYSQSHTFDGGEYVGLGNTLGFDNTNPFSITTWYKSSASSNQFTILGKKASPNSLVAGYDLWHFTDGTIRFEISSTVTQLQIQTVSNYDDGNWHYIVATYDGSGNRSGMKLYVDNTLITTGTSSSISTTSANAGNFVIGADGSGNNGAISQLDNVKIYPYALSSSQINSDYNSISPISSGKQFMSWYNGVSGSSTLTKKLGFGTTPITMSCSLSSARSPSLASNGTKVYYSCPPVSTASPLNHFDVVSGTSSHDYSVTDYSGGGSVLHPIFMNQKSITFWSVQPSGFQAYMARPSGNTTLSTSPGSLITSNQKVFGGTWVFKYNFNNTQFLTGTSNQCELNYSPTNTTKKIDDIACDPSVPANVIKYWNGMLIQGIGNYVTNSTQQFLNSIDASAYKKLLSLPCVILVNESPCVDFILTDSTQTDYLIVLTSTHVYYVNALNALHVLTQNNYALQSYDVVTTTTTPAYEIPNPILQDMTLYGFSLNTTIHKTGMFTLPSGYSLRTTTISPSIRLIDPRWSDDATDMPIISSTSSLFPIFLTISNAPTFSAIKVTQGNQIINSQESVWAIAQLDSTRSVEFDLPSATCANIYVADISVSPSIWNFEGIVCATGLNQKTVSYTNTLPISFWTSKYSATHSYTPSSNALSVTTRATTGPFSENIIIKNSNGTTITNFNATVNGTIDTQNFNVSGIGKPLTLYVNVDGNPIYQAFLGSAVSFASVSSFFATYFSYHGFNLLSLIPIIFAGMFTRNSVGIGAVAVVLLIASLNFFSLVVIPEAVITVMMFISLIGLIAYRVILY